MTLEKVAPNGVFAYYIYTWKLDLTSRTLCIQMPVNREIIPDTCFRLISKIFAANGWSREPTLRVLHCEGVRERSISVKKEERRIYYIYICAISCFNFSFKSKDTYNILSIVSNKTSHEVEIIT